MKSKYVYSFEEGKKEMKEILGGKGANLAEMTSLGIPVPPGFIVTTEVCEEYYENDKKYPGEVLKQIEEKLAELEKKIGKKLGAKEDPLLVSVRSGAAISMPGMMDTVLNLGLNDESVIGLAEKTKNERFAWDSYRRFIQMFGDVVMGVEHHKFEEQLTEMKKAKGVETDTELDAEDLKKLVEKFKEIVKKSAGKLFPNDPREQMQMSINAVFGSWNNDRAVSYRRINNIKGLKGTAINVQVMVYGNMGKTSGTGVYFTRDPSTGENKFYGEFLMNAQGEDVVAGIRTPRDIEELKDELPKCYAELVEIYKKIEGHYKEMQDMEFTIQEGKLYILQTRSGKRTAHAAVKIAVDMVDEKLIDEKTAVMRIPAEQIDTLLHKQIDPVAKKEFDVLAKGLPASPGAAVGQVVFTAEKARDWQKEGKKVILVRTETSPEDIEGMDAAKGVLTSRGGMTSHAAVVARGMGKCCVAGADKVKINEKEGYFMVEGVKIKEGDIITLDGSTGELFEGELGVVDPELSDDFEKLMGWADKFRKLKVRTNADTPHDSKVAIGFGAEGIGLCRTEHMFFQGDRIKAVREMILAYDEEGRRKALAKLLPYQKEDFMGIFKEMDGRPVTIRLLDPPLHEFLPHGEKEIEEIAKVLDVSVEKLKEKINELKEFNPMLGHRGCRLVVTYPEIAEMQTEAIISAACELVKKGKKVVPEIMVPLVGMKQEFDFNEEIIRRVAEETIKKYGVKLDYLVGTMIEVPRGALIADELAKKAEFFSFGTNDLTQMTFGFSRDDAGRFITDYMEKGLFEKDPFQTLDQTGTGQLMKIAIKKGRKVRKDLKLGICGEHGGEPESVKFCHKIGLDYVSCSPFRVPIARLVAAQAALEE
ncbi:MAG: pyruvate, phosphate dikinase [Nanoarchaeota archaeon]|nr:pyruvate, phosphate dikinase [Nanoarchaeota archaeon]MCG2717291.1 pyruvate, phosphate dikinase [Nanoarchaeota archaeon]